MVKLQAFGAVHRKQQQAGLLVPHLAPPLGQPVDELASSASWYCASSYQIKFTTKRTGLPKRLSKMRFQKTNRGIVCQKPASHVAIHFFQRQQLGHRLPPANQPGLPTIDQHLRCQRAGVVVR